jgi:hypothetical protein
LKNINRRGLFSKPTGDVCEHQYGQRDGQWDGQWDGDYVNEEWANQHPNCINDGTRENKRYLKISNAISLGNIAKVIKRVAKNVAIDKDAPQHPADTA